MPLPPLTLNRKFIGDFSDAAAPCCALGLVKSASTITGFLAVKPDPAIPNHVLGLGMGFGHRMIATQGGSLVCQFAFNFYGFAQYSVLVNPSNVLALKVMEAMVAQKDYFFFILNSDERVSAFRSDLNDENLAGMRDSIPIMRSATTTEAVYEQAVSAFWRAPDPVDMKALNWVCRDDPTYLDLEDDTIDLPPVG